METQLEIKEENFKRSLQEVKEENKAGTENEIQMLKIQILELKEKNDEFDREKLNLKTLVSEKDQWIEELSSFLTQMQESSVENISNLENELQ